MTTTMTMRVMLGAMIVLAMGGCKSIEYVPVESVRTQHQDRIVVVSDTVVVSDSVVICERGDTIVREKWRIKERIRWAHDTVLIERIDSIQVPVVIEKKQKDKGAWWIWLLLAGLAGAWAGRKI